MAADFIAFDLANPNFAGALHDPVAALVFCTPAQVAVSVINGHIVARQGQLTTVDLPVIIEQHNRLATTLLSR
jgi:cytosine/adenosine deaminase-related metal-dependent hydrolase